MSYEFRLPDIGEGVAEGEVVQWFVQEGGPVLEDAPLVSVLTDKANVEIPSPKSGRIVKIHAQVGEKVKVGGILVTIEESGGTPASPAGGAPQPRAGSGASRPAASGAAARTSATEPRPTSGPARSDAAPGNPSASPTPAAEGPARILATPYLRRLASERGIDLGHVTGTGPGGRIQESDLGGRAPGPDVSASTQVPRGSPSAAGSASGPPRTATAGPSNAGEFQRVPIRGIRRVISERMSASVHTAAHFTYVEEIEVSELVRLRDRMAKHIEVSGGAKLSYLPFIVKAVVQGLKAHPWMNARMDDAQGELDVFSSYHIGIAAATPEGLIVPVIHHAERKSLNQLAREIQELSERAREGKLTLAELSGGTFTITSLGALGGILATPILNYPEVAILGVHKIQRRPAYLTDGSIGPGQFMNLSVSLDHRVLDGIVGAQFLAVVKAHLEDPHSLFADMA
ncbi:MAG: 2-oxo acid dehydrogenase subunit E2 [Thermoplasmata archaeon]|nr:2-oxo acid dehydrogenase subunit E2 [Thermoplasmata archaeon]MCI4358810.1 2-oxo acid dehydrogenase subunit E2 [Thermoplasmata archaeon]